MNRLLGTLYAFAAILLLVWASGCGPTLMAQSAPPPGRTARLDEVKSHYELDISAGVAIAISCYHGGPCQNLVVSTENASIADVRGASFGALEKNQYTMATSTIAGFVIVGKAPGTTKVKVKTKDGDKTINVTVVPPPVVGAPAKAVARQPN